MAAAPWPLPPKEGTTLWQVTDTHVAQNQYAWTLPHFRTAGADIEKFGERFHIDCRLHTGDIVNNGGQIPQQDTDAKGVLRDYFTEPLAGGQTAIIVPGNHDVNDFYNRTLAQWEATYGRQGNTSTIIGKPGYEMKVLGICPLSHPEDPLQRDIWPIDETTISWMDSELAADSMPTWIACHYMLQEHGSFGTGTKAQPEDELTALISSYPHVVGWLSGHSHWRITAPTGLAMLQVGGRTAFPSLSGPSTAFSAYLGDTDKSIRPGPIWGTVITYLDADRIEVRFRDHGAAMWASGWEGKRVSVLTPS